MSVNHNNVVVGENGSFCAYHLHEGLDWIDSPPSLKHEHIKKQLHHQVAVSNGPKGLTNGIGKVEWSAGTNAPSTQPPAPPLF